MLLAVALVSGWALRRLQRAQVQHRIADALAAEVEGLAHELALAPLDLPPEAAFADLTLTSTRFDAFLLDEEGRILSWCLGRWGPEGWRDDAGAEAPSADLLFPRPEGPGVTGGQDDDGVLVAIQPFDWGDRQLHVAGRAAAPDTDPLSGGMLDLFGEATEASPFARGLLPRALLVCLVAALAGLLAVRLLTSRLAALEDAVSRLGAGDLSVRLDAGPGDEVGRVVDGFNAMAANLDAARAELERQAQARRELLADVSHELRTPITAMLCQLEVLDGEGQLDAEARRAMTRAAIEEGRAVGERVEDLMLLARADVESLPLALRPVVLQRELQGLVRKLRPRFEEEGVQLETDFGPEPLELVADPRRLHQVTRNLLENARRALREGGRVVVRTFAKDAETVAIEVQDDGPGIDPDELPTLFARFQRGTSSREGDGGTGLGLAIVQRLTRRHGGRVEAESTPGAGSTFRVLLPRAGPENPSTPPARPGEDGEDGEDGEA